MTLSFSYRLRPVRVVFGAGSVARLAEVTREIGLRRVLLVTTPGRRTAIDAALGVLADAAADVFDGAAQHVPDAAVTAALGVAERVRADGTVAIGGGSAIGLAKALALRAGLPVVAVPTT